MGKIINKEEIKKIIENLKNNNKKTVFTNGCFDVLHVGHTRYLKASKQYGDILVIGLNSDNSVKKIKGNSRPINSEFDRAEILSELNFVDYVVIFDEASPSQLIDEIKPDIYTKGADYTMETLPEAFVVKKNNIKVHFINFIEGKSTTSIINKINNGRCGKIQKMTIF